MLWPALGRSTQHRHNLCSTSHINQQQPHVMSNVWVCVCAQGRNHWLLLRPLPAVLPLHLCTSAGLSRPPGLFPGRQAAGLHGACVTVSVMWSCWVLLDAEGIFACVCVELTLYHSCTHNCHSCTRLTTSPPPPFLPSFLHTHTHTGCPVPTRTPLQTSWVCGWRAWAHGMAA